MRIGIIIPDRNDRPLFLKNCMRLIQAQTLQPEIIELVNYEAESENVDITQRYRRGYDNLRNKGLDVIALIENDEWYSHDYLEIMVNGWVNNGKPDIFGTNYTIYYHIKLFAYFTMHHLTRSSAMSTLIKPDLNFKWCVDDQPYTDLHLWSVLKGVTFKPNKTICLGIKHGVGLCGGVNHVDKLHRFTNKDEKFVYLHKHMIQEHDDFESFNFYTQYYK